MNTFETIFYLIGQAPSTPPPPGGTFGSFVPFILIFVIFYFLLIRPQKQKQKKLQKQVDAMRTGDKVITAGGIHGLVTNVKKESVTVKVDNNTKIEFEKGSIATVIGILKQVTGITFKEIDKKIFYYTKKSPFD